MFIYAMLPTTPRELTKSVASMAANRHLLTHCAANRHHVRMFDLENAFLQAHIDESEYRRAFVNPLLSTELLSMLTNAKLDATSLTNQVTR